MGKFTTNWYLYKTYLPQTSQKTTNTKLRHINRNTQVNKRGGEPRNQEAEKTE